MSQKRLKQIRKVIENQSTEKVVFKQKSIRSIIIENWKFILFILIGAILIYLNGMNANFVSDDYATIPNNPNVADIGFSITDKDSQNLVVFANTIVAALFGIGSPTPFHLFSLFVYLLNCVAVFVFIYQLFGKYEAMLTTLIFAFHPIHVEAVTWISGKPYTMSTLFILLSLISLKALMDSGKRKYLLFLIFVSILSYKSEGARSLTIFFLVPLLLMYQGLKGIKLDLKKIFLVLAILGPIILIIIWPKIMYRIGVVNSGYNTSESIFYNPFFQYPTSVAKYLQLLTFPIDLTLYHTMYVFPVWLNWAILLTYVTAVIYFFFRNKGMFFALSLIFLASVSSMAPVKVSWLVAERYMFFGSVGYSLAIGLILYEIGRKNTYIAVSLLSLILVLFSVRTYMRNIDWQTNHNLWVNTCQVSPNSHNAWNNIGDDYDKLKQYDNAVKGFTQSTIVKPNYADAYHNRANIFYKTGRLDLARDSYETALIYSPALYQTYLSLINIDLIEKKYDLALSHAQKSLQLQPNDANANYLLAVVYVQRNEIDKAKAVLEAILKAYPNFKQAADALAQIKTGIVK